MDASTPLVKSWLQGQLSEAGRIVLMSIALQEEALFVRGQQTLGYVLYLLNTESSALWRPTATADQDNWPTILNN